VSVSGLKPPDIIKRIKRLAPHMEG
jgi:hypothetical protein